MKWLALGWFALGVVLWGSAWQVIPLAVFLAFVWTWVTVPLCVVAVLVLVVRLAWGKKG